MLDFFAEKLLPGEDPSTPIEAQKTDVSSFTDLWLTADLIESCCLMPSHEPGWAAAGMSFLLRNLFLLADCHPGTSDSIGVFIWTASCYEDRLVPPGVPTFALATNTTSEKLQLNIGSETRSAIVH